MTVDLAISEVRWWQEMSYDSNRPGVLDAAVILADEIERLRDRVTALESLVQHCHIHSGYRDCGSGQMTTAERELYREVVSREDDES